MTRFEIEDCLNSMIICVDTREQDSERAVKRYESFGCPYRRQTLAYGDYTYNFKVNGNYYFNDIETIQGDAVIERKMSLTELSGNFTKNRDRFIAEFERMKANNASVYLLVEDASWEKLRSGKYGTKYNPIAYMASLVAWMARYNCKVIFCKNEISGPMIKEILYRELKERLERGVYG